MELVKKMGTTPARKVESFEQIKDDAHSMLAMLDEGIKKGDGYANGAALHHAQVSNDPFDFFVVADQYKNLFGGRLRRIVINPKITDQQYLIPFEEGCLSFLNRNYVKTRRFKQIGLKYSYANTDNEIRSKEVFLSGFGALMVQHEVDHGQGGNIYDGRFDEYNPRVELDKEK